MKGFGTWFVLRGFALERATPVVRQAHAKGFQMVLSRVTVTPPVIRISFAVLNLGPIPVCSIHFTPVTVGLSNADSCKILSCSSAPGWSCQTTPGGGAFWRTLPGFPCIGPGEKHEPFDVELDPLYCCYRAEDDDGNGQIFFTDLACF